MQHSKLSNVVFISVPKNLHVHFEEFAIDPDVLLPVETSGGGETYNLDELTWEMVLAGMLRVLAYAPDHDDAAYYRSFVIAMRPDIVGELSQAGIEQAAAENWEIAEEILLALRGVAPDLIEARVNLAVLFEQRAEAYERHDQLERRDELLDAAFEIYRELIAEHDHLPSMAHFNAGVFFLRRGNFDRARAQLELYLQSDDPDEKRVERARRFIAEIGARNLVDTLFREAYDLVKLGREAEGIERINAFLQKNPTVWNGWFILGWAQRRSGNFSAAAEAFAAAVQHGADNADTFNELAICSMELGQLDAARKNLEAALQREPENTKIISNFGVLELKRGNKAEAKRFFETVLEFDPEDPVARAYLEGLQ